jgi:hypothetical protein
MNNVHEDEPVVFQTRWTLSYLRGPLTREQINKLMEGGRAGATDMPAEPGTPKAEIRPVSSVASITASARPVLPPEIPQVFVPLRSAQPSGGSLVYHPMLIGSAQTYYRDPKAGVDTQDQSVLVCEISDTGADWSAAKPMDVADSDLESSPQQQAVFADLPPAASQGKSYDAWKKSFADALYRIAKLDLLRSPSLNQFSKPGEMEADFRARLALAAREKRDQISEQLKSKYATRLAGLQDRIRRAEMAKDVQAKQASASKFQTAISFGATVLGAFMGRKTLSAGNIGKAATAARGVGRSMKESQDVARAEENVEAIQQQYADLEAQFKADVDALTGKIDPVTERLETVSLRPKKTDITVKRVALAWAPYWQTPSGEAPAWQ